MTQAETGALSLDTHGRPITPSRLRRAINMNILAGAGGIAWYAVCSPQAVLNVFFKNHLGGSASELGLLVALTQLAAPFHLLAVLIYARLQTRKVFFAAAHVLHRLLGYVLAGVALYAAQGGEKSLGISIVTAASVTSFVLATISAAGWWSWLADLIPEGVRGAFFGRRSTIIQAVNVVWFFSVQVALDAFGEGNIFYVYTIVFAVGGTLGVLDILLHTFIPEPQRHPGELRGGWRRFIQPLRSRNFLRFSLSIGLWSFATSILGPFVAPYITASTAEGGIGAANTWLGIMYIITQATWIATATPWGLVMDRFGRKPVVLLGAMHPVIPWIGYFFMTPGNYAYILPVTAMEAGILGLGYWNGAAQLMLTLTPQKNRTAFIAWHSVLVGTIAAGGSLVGGRLADALAGFHANLAGVAVGNFHVVAVVSFVMLAVSLLTISRIREGREKPVGYVVSRLASPGVFRTFLNLSILGGGGGATSARTARALRSVERGPGDLVMADVIARLDDPDHGVREEAARALGRIRSPDAVDVLLACLRDPHSSIRPQAARALGQIGDPRAVEALTQCLESASADLRQACADALHDIAGREPAPPAPKATRALRTMERADDDLPAADIIARLDDADHEVREEAARALGRIRSPQAVETLIRHLCDPNSTIRPQAARALGQIGDGRAIEALTECLASGSVELQEACAEALGAVGGRMPIRRLISLLGEQHHERVIVSGAEAVSEHGIVEAAWEILPRMHTTKNPVLRRQLAIAIGNLLGRPGEFYPYLTGERAQEGRRLGTLVRRARRALAAVRRRSVRRADEISPRGLPHDTRANVLWDDLGDELGRVRGLMEGQSYRAAVEALYGIVRRLVAAVTGRETTDETALEYALLRDTRLGLGFWFVIEVKRRMGETGDVELLHTDALLALYFLGAYRLPP
jgi:HEAT repeat protein